MESKYEYKVVKPEGVPRNIGWGFVEKIHEQVCREAENGWDYYRETAGLAMVFRRLRQPNQLDQN